MKDANAVGAGVANRIDQVDAVCSLQQQSA